MKLVIHTAVAAFSLCLATAANAAVMVVDVYGTVLTGGANSLDVFKTGGTGSLAGKGVHTQFIFDTDAPGVTMVAQPGHIALYALAAPGFMKASATIDGVTVFTDQSAPQAGGSVEYYNNSPDTGGTDEVQYAAFSYNPNTTYYREISFRYFDLQGGEILNEDSFTETFDQIPPSEPSTDGYFQFSRNGQSTLFEYRAHRVTVSEFQAVPEPGVWALMIVGFGLAGASLRSRLKGRFAPTL